MRIKLTILLVILNVALFSYILYFNKVQSTRTLFDETNRLILETGFVQDIDQIHIQSFHIDKPWILSKTDGQWSVDSPVQWKANPFAVEQLLFQLRRLSWESRFSVKDVLASGRSLQAYNLENPSIRIDLLLDGRTVRLALGAPTEIGNRLYLLSPDGEYVYVVNRSLLDIMQRDLEAFLDRRVFGLAARSVRGIQIQDRSTSNVRVRLERKDANWEFVSPIATRADGERVETFIQTWQSLEVEGFETGEGAIASLPGEALKLTFEGMGRRETLLLAPYPEAGREGVYLAKREAYPALFKVEAGLVEELRTTQEDLRERRIFSGFSENWTSLEIQMGHLNVTLQQLEGGGWQVLYTDEDGQLKSTPASLAAIVSLQELLGTMEAVRFVSDAPSEADRARYGLDDPQRRVQLRMPSGNLVEFEVGGAAPEEGATYLYARTNQSNSVFLVRPYILSEFSLDPLHYRERKIRMLPETVILEDVDLTDRRSGDSLLERAPVTEVDNLRELVKGYLRTTRVDRFLNREFSDPLPLDATENLDWDFLMEARPVYPNNPTENAQRIHLYLTKRLGGSTQYVGDPESGLVGTLPLHLVEALDPVLTTHPVDPVPTRETEEPAADPEG